MSPTHKNKNKIIYTYVDVYNEKAEAGIIIMLS